MRRPLLSGPPSGDHRDMTKYLISFPSEAMVLTDEEFPVVSAEAHAVIEEAKAAGLPLLAGTPRVHVRPGELGKKERDG
jgi:hypothetical protein